MVQQSLSFKHCLIKEHSIILPSKWVVVVFLWEGRKKMEHKTPLSHSYPNHGSGGTNTTSVSPFLFWGGTGGLNFPFIFIEIVDAILTLSEMLIAWIADDRNGGDLRILSPFNRLQCPLTHLLVLFSKIHFFFLWSTDLLWLLTFFGDCGVLFRSVFRIRQTSLSVTW